MKAESKLGAERKSDNRNRVFNLVREAENISKPGVSRELGISVPTAIQYINELEELGAVKEGGQVGCTGGRKAKAYSVDETYRYAIGVELKARQMIIVAVDYCGNLIHEDIEDCPFVLKNEYYKKLGALLEEKIDKWGLEREKVLGVGIALPGLVTENCERVYYGKVLNYEETSVQELGKYISYPCRLYNNSDSAGYAEIARDPETNDAVLIRLGENVGGSVIINGEIYGAKSGKVGHIQLVPGGKKCYCGRRGCFETVCNEELLKKACRGTVSEFFEKLAGGDAACKKAWEKYIGYVAEAIVNVRMLFDNKIIIGGAFSEYMEPYFEDLLRRVTVLDTFDNPETYLRLSHIKHQAPALGGALQYIHESWKNL